MAASATFALKAGLWVRRARFAIIAPDRRHSRRSQAEIPLIGLSEFARPPLTYRLHPLKKETTVPWHALSDHFGSESGHRQLAFRLKEVLRDVTTVYPEANVEASGRGIILRPSRSSVATACSLVRLPSTVGRA